MAHILYPTNPENGNGWREGDLKVLGELIMRIVNPYKILPTAPKPLGDVAATMRQDTTTVEWVFRNTPIQVRKAIEIPYFVWYPVVRQFDLNKPKHFLPEPSSETLLVGYVGGGGV